MADVFRERVIDEEEKEFTCPIYRFVMLNFSKTKVTNFVKLHTRLSSRQRCEPFENQEKIFT